MSGHSLPFILYEEQHKHIATVIDQLAKDAMSTAIFLIDRNGQLIANSGRTDAIDMTSLASLAAGNMATTGGMAKLLGENEFPTNCLEGQKENLHISRVGSRGILGVIYDVDRSSLGLVRLRVRKATAVLEQIFEAIERQSHAQMQSRVGGSTPLSDISDEDIENLFMD